MDERKYFTVEQANRALPLVRRIVEDICTSATELRTLAAVRGQSDESGDHRRQIHRIERDLRRCVDELGQVGCELKDTETGLLDFYAQHEGRDILLCWMRGEDRVAYWHDIEAGFRGRRPVAELSEETRGAPQGSSPSSGDR